MKRETIVQCDKKWFWYFRRQQTKDTKLGHLDGTFS